MDKNGLLLLVYDTNTNVQFLSILLSGAVG